MNDGRVIAGNRSPPFSLSAQLNSEPINSVIPGEYINITTATTFLITSLTQEKANAIFQHLWFAGKPQNFRALHEQHVFRRAIIACEEPSLHMIWHNDVIYIKPLPPCLTNYEFFKQHVCPNDEVFRLACGFLYSYTLSVRFESDFRIATKAGLIRESNLTWEKWQQFRLSAKAFFDANPNVIDKRYRYV